MEPGERLQSIYGRHFRHRYGGHAPSWTGISAAERALWAEVEVELTRELAARWFALEDEIASGGQTPSH